jgi:hypothetical protein
MSEFFGRRFRIGVMALALIGTTLAVGLSVAPTTAGAVTGNLIQNGNFHIPGHTTSTLLPVHAGDSTTIKDWTVVTPAMYEGGGSVDVVSTDYWNAEKGKYSIDLAGSTGVPGGLYQDVATTSGEEYTLSFWSAVNGDQKPGFTHTTNVSVNGSSVDTVQAVGVGRPLDWVQNTATFIASSTTSKIEFDDATPRDTNKGPTLDNVSLVATPDVITASSETLAQQTIGTAPPAYPLATFTDSYPTAPPTNFTATITWGDGNTSTIPGTAITQSGSTYTVSGTHSYDADDTYTVGVSIVSIAGGSDSVSDSVTVADDAVGMSTCTGSGCSGTTSTSTETVDLSSTSTTGTIITTLDPPDTGPDCGDPFRHAPEVTTFDETGLDANVVYTVTFDESDAAGEWYLPFEVCYSAGTPFTDYFGNTDVTTGLLPQCGDPATAPCYESITQPPYNQGNTGTVVETILLPPSDAPKFH